jgi:hypothetical protein
MFHPISAQLLSYNSFYHLGTSGFDVTTEPLQVYPDSQTNYGDTLHNGYRSASPASSNTDSNGSMAAEDEIDYIGLPIAVNQNHCHDYVVPLPNCRHTTSSCLSLPGAVAVNSQSEQLIREAGSSFDDFNMTALSEGFCQYYVSELPGDQNMAKPWDELFHFTNNGLGAVEQQAGDSDNNWPQKEHQVNFGQASSNRLGGGQT